jgi:DNA-binding MarR family transcriptional regulator
VPDRSFRRQPLITIDGRARDALRTHLRIATCYNLLMREARQRVASRWDLTLPQFDVLAELARADASGFTFAELSRLLVVTSGNLTGIVDRLGKHHLVRRTPDPRDRRVIRVALTEKGRRMTDDMLPVHAADIDEILSFMPRSVLVRLSSLLGMLREGLHRRAGAATRENSGSARSTSANTIKQEQAKAV